MTPIVTIVVGTDRVTLFKTAYADGALAVLGYMEAPMLAELYLKLSVNMPTSRSLPPGTFFVKDWSENSQFAAAAFASGAFELAEGIPQAESGFVSAKAWRIKS